VIHGFKAILLKDGGFLAIRFDLFFLFVFRHRHAARRHAAVQTHFVIPCGERSGCTLSL